MSVLEVHIGRIESAQPVAEVLAEVRTLPPEQQFCALNPHSLYGPSYRLSPDLKAEDIEAFMDFAVQPDERVPLLVRVQAVQRVAEQIIQSPDALAEYHRDLNDVLPTGPAASAAYGLQNRTINIEGSGVLGISWWLHNDLTWLLMHKAGISKRAVFPEWDQFSFDPSSMPDFNPALGIMYLTQMAQKGVPGKLGKLAPLAAEFKATCSELITSSPADTLEKELPLMGLVGYAEHGIDHMAVAKELFKDLGSNDAAKTLNELSADARGLSMTFPPEYNVTQGVNELMANSLYALREHYRQNGKTDVRLPLNGELDVLPLSLADDEPLQLLRHLCSAMKIMSQTGLWNDPVVVRATNEPGFAIYRSFHEGQQSSVYIRPEASYTYRQDMEYGRPGSGVEASISFVVDPTLQPGQLLEIGKHRGSGPDNRISIRLDREGLTDSAGRRDPTTEQGILSLDVSSIIGNDTWLGTKLGRFLAWGNVLRGRSVGEDFNLNHVRRYFTGTDGRADYFAEVANDLRNRFEGRALSDARLQKLIANSGSFALNGRQA